MLAIDGTVVGAVTASEGSGSLLTINQQAHVTGDVTADTVLISGRVRGNVRARQRVELLRTGHLVGDIYTKDVMVEGGAVFEGFCHMEQDGAVSAGDKMLAQPAAHSSAPQETAPQESAQQEAAPQDTAMLETETQETGKL